MLAELTSSLLSAVERQAESSNISLEQLRASGEVGQRLASGLRERLLSEVEEAFFYCCFVLLSVRV